MIDLESKGEAALGDSGIMIRRGGRQGLGARDGVKGRHPVSGIVKIRSHI